jgi:hypothetical protein
MQLQVTINGATLTALLDSGFMHNFLDAHVAARVGITFHDRPGCELLLSKWFHNTSSDTVIRAARKGSLIGGTKTLDAQGVSYDETRWFTWFRPPERNTIHQRENGSCCIAVCCSNLGLNCLEESNITCLALSSI